MKYDQNGQSALYSVLYGAWSNPCAESLDIQQYSPLWVIVI